MDDRSQPAWTPDGRKREGMGEEAAEGGGMSDRRTRKPKSRAKPTRREIDDLMRVPPQDRFSEPISQPRKIAKEKEESWLIECTRW